MALVALTMSVTTQAQIYDGSFFSNEELMNQYDDNYAMFDGRDISESVTSFNDRSLNVNNGLFGTQITPFETAGEPQYAGSLRTPPGEPTNNVPVGSAWCLVVGLLLLIVVRVLHTIKLSKRQG